MEAGQVPLSLPSGAEPARSGQLPDLLPSAAEPARSGQLPDLLPSAAEPAGSGQLLALLPSAAELAMRGQHLPQLPSVNVNNETVQRSLLPIYIYKDIKYTSMVNPHTYNIYMYNHLRTAVFTCCETRYRELGPLDAATWLCHIIISFIKM